MRSSSFRFLCLITLGMALLLVATACDKDKTTKPIMDFGVVAGTVYSPGKSVLPGVTVSIGDVSTVTDDYGAFVLSGIDAGAHVRVDFMMEGKASTQKVVEVEKGRTTYTSATLFNTYSVTFDPAFPFYISNGAEINVPEEAFVGPSGSPFTGSVRIAMHYFDPTVPECLNAFPGGFEGVQTDGTTTMFESYGFISASFYDAANPEVELQLAAGKQAQIQAPIPYALQAGAPESIPMWYYDDETGQWHEEGVATKQGNSYIGSVSHFSYWNFDHPVVIDDQSTLTGMVVTGDRGDPVPGAQVVATGVNYAGYTTTYTDDDGAFTVTVKAGAQVKLQAFSGTSASYQSSPINTPAGGGTAAVDDLVITDRSFSIIGRLVNSSGDPITGYGNITQLNPPSGDMGFSSWLTLEDDGTFEVNAQHYGTTNSFDVMFSVYTRNSLFSSSIAFTVPQPGNIWDFGDVVMRPGGNLTGRAQLEDGTFVSSAWISFNQEGATGEGSHMSAETDANGNFTLSGPPNTRFTNMKANVWIESMGYASNSMTLNFPASGASRSIGTITLYPEE